MQDLPTTGGRERLDRRLWSNALVTWLAVLGALLMVSGVILWNAYALAGGDSPGWRLVGIASRMLYAGREQNITTWYSTLLLAGTSLGLAMHALALTAQGRRAGAYAWLAAIALLLSADEAAAMHEQLGRVAEFLQVGLPWTFSWLVLGVPFVVGACVFVAWLARPIDPWLRTRLTVAAGVFLLGAIGFEMLGGFVVTQGSRSAGVTLLYQAVQLLEEGLEIAGALIALWATLDALDLRVGPNGLSVRTRLHGPNPG